MTFPATAKFPGAIWDGSSDTRNTSNVDEPVLQVYRAPDPADYSQITAELIAVQYQVGAGGISGPTATSGYFFVPKVAGAPTGVPTNVPAGFLALAYDSTDHKIYVYDGGWKATVALS